MRTRRNLLVSVTTSLLGVSRQFGVVPKLAKSILSTKSRFRTEAPIPPGRARGDGALQDSRTRTDDQKELERGDQLTWILLQVRCGRRDGDPPLPNPGQREGRDQGQGRHESPSAPFCI